MSGMEIVDAEASGSAKDQPKLNLSLIVCESVDKVPQLFNHRI